MRALGYIRDPLKPLGTTPDRSFDELQLTTPPPKAASAEKYILSVLDQGRIGSCVANSIAQALRASHVRQGIVEPTLPSRLWIYWWARATHHATRMDNGTFIRNAFDAINKVGFPSESAWPYSDTKSPARLVDGSWIDDISRDDAPFQKMPRDAAVQAAHPNRSPTVYRRIGSIGARRVLDCKRAIADGRLVVFGTDVSMDFVNAEFDPAEDLMPPRDREDIAGGHAMVLCGYDGDRFRVCNSWGSDFGMNGFVFHASEYVEAYHDLWVVDHAPVVGER